MQSVAALFSGVLILAGFGALALSFTTRIITGEQLGIAAIAAFACAAALGVWRIVGMIEREQREKRKLPPPMIAPPPQPTWERPAEKYRS